MTESAQKNEKNLFARLQGVRRRRAIVARRSRILRQFTKQTFPMSASREQRRMDLGLTDADGGWFYRRDDRWAVAPRRSDFVYAFNANRTERVIGWYQSQVNKASRPYFSELERQTMMLLDLTSNVRRFAAQPTSISYRYGYDACFYTPDLLVELTSQTKVYLEVKPKAKILEPDMRSRLPAICRAFAEMGAVFKVVTDEDLAREPRRKNIRSLQLYRSIEPDLETAHRIDGHLSREGSASLAHLASLCPDPVLGRQTVMALIYRRHLKINLNAPITHELPVRHVMAA